MSGNSMYAMPGEEVRDISMGYSGQRSYDNTRLHNTLYPRPDLHPGNAYYALVCRVALGTPHITREQLPHDWTPPAAAAGVHSLLAEEGVGVGGFREFVVFDKRAIKIEYLVCFTRAKRYCRCSIPLRVRTVTRHDGERTLMACDNSRKGEGGRWVGGCGLAACEPRCYCRDAATGQFRGSLADRERGVFCCEGRGGVRCGFQQLVEQVRPDGSAPVASRKELCYPQKSPGKEP